ncbi:MAG: HAD-IA family hydrolase [Bacteriovoracaceae bacterium]|nr:HAD-IA family hydrolase [Bacteriovoracaceae bacterium]
MTISKENAKAHVVFDNDGTMIDSESNFYQVLTVVLPKYLGREITMEEILDAYIPDWIQLLSNLGLADSSRETLQAIINDVNYENRDFTPTLYPGIKELIEMLHSMEVATYVWTGRESESALKILESHKIKHLFHDMQFMDTTLPKPNPAGLEVMLGDMDKSKIVLIGDSIVDIKGAKNFEIPCLVVDWDNKSDHQQLLDEGAVLITKKTDDIIQWVKQNLL